MLAGSYDSDNLSAMSMFKVNVTARNPKREELATQPLSALVDTGFGVDLAPGRRFERSRDYATPEASLCDGHAAAE